VTVYEHMMVGASLALGAGLHHKHGWRIVGLAAVAAALPDWDGLSILLGSQAYTKAHRVWGHNLLVALSVGGLAGAVELGYHFSERLRRSMRRVLTRITPAANSSKFESKITASALILWIGTGAVASLSHLVVDIFYSGHRGGDIWPLRLLWPFSNSDWAFPIIDWGDLGATIIFIAEMFALYRWPALAQRIAWAGLAAVCLYVGTRWLLSVS